jgi:membrane-associated PAP2 superfamily phosphatase
MKHKQAKAWRLLHCRSAAKRPQGSFGGGSASGFALMTLPLLAMARSRRKAKSRSFIEAMATAERLGFSRMEGSQSPPAIRRVGQR